MLTENQLFANRYRLVKRLGQGAFSEVWKAEDTLVGNLTVALKVYAPDKGLDEDGAKVFGDEFAIVFNLHHQNLLTPSTFDKEKNSPYLVLPFCEQGSSLKLVGKMDERQAAKFLHDVSAALAYLHESEIVHQDIKPDNVLMDAKGNFLVTDFGISTRIRSTLRRSVGGKSSSGTSAYMGPERFSKTPAPIKASDVWSLGATVFELLTGDVPYGDMGGGLQKIGAEIPDLPKEYSAGLKSLIERCLSQEPWERPTAAQLRDICDGYLRTGVWDLSSIDGGAKPDKEPQTSPRDDRPTKRPTQRKVTAEPAKDTPPPKTPPQTSQKPKADSQKKDSTRLKPRKRLPWIIGGTAAVVILAVVLGVTFGKGKKVRALAQTYTVNGVSFTMKYVKGGAFKMGVTKKERRDASLFDSDETPVHKVTVSDFCIGETEVTQALWKAVIGGNPSHVKGDDNRPVESVSWNDCQIFIKKLNALTGKTFRLPTEAEWEYAARGGRKNRRRYMYAGSNNPTEVAWFNRSKTHPVMNKKANELGLYDMSGNVCEWCQDGYGSKYYRDSPLVNPTGRENSLVRVQRGGHSYGSYRYCRVSSRDYGDPDYRGHHLGFRLALVPK